MDKWNNKVAYRLTLLFVAVAGMALLFLMDHIYREAVIEEHDHRLNEAASTMQRHLSVRLNHLTLVASDLRAFLLTQPTPPNPREFADFSATLLYHYPELDALVYVGPDRIIQQIYPLKGNEGAIGLDLRKRPAAPYIERAIHENVMIVDPPHILTNGRLAVMARQPLFRDGQLLGVAQVILHVPDAINNELVDLGNEFTIQLRDENGKIFWGEERVGAATLRREVVVGNGAWTLLVAHAKPPQFNQSILALIWGGGGLTLLLILMGIHHNDRLHLALKGRVAEATRELHLRNRQLEEQIQQREAVEVYLRRSEQSLREAQQIARLGNWAWDLDENKIYWSSEMFRIFGLVPDEIEPTYEEFYARVHPEDRETLQQELPEVLASGVTYSRECRIILPNSTISYVRMSGISELDAKGNPRRVVGTVQDITSQKIAIHALEESERKYRVVLEHASDGIIIASIDGYILDSNQRIQQLLGYSRNELLNLHVSKIHPPEDADRLHAAFVSMREQGTSLIEHLLLRKDGTTTPVEVAGTCVNIEGQQVALGVFRDISERKRIEAELQQYRNHLEQLVEQRTAELVALNSELETFSYSVSHDLRAPLRAINGFSVALSEDYQAQLDKTGRNYLERITSATMRMGRLIDDLLYFSSTNRTVMHWERVSLSTIVAELLQELADAESGRCARWVIAENVSAYGDLTLIRSLLQNLLSNAWKFTRSQSEAVIEFGIARHREKCVCFVRDNGIGFEMRQASELFKPFYRLHGVTDYEGSGIGLATVQRIVQRHGGEVWAEGIPMQGATFYFTFGTEVQVPQGARLTEDISE